MSITNICCKTLMVLAAVAALACAGGAPAAPSGTTPPVAVSEPQPTAPAAAAVQQPVVTAAPAPQSETSPPAQPQAESKAATTQDRPTLKVGEVWLSSPLDPAEGGEAAYQAGMSETLFRLSGTTLGAEPWLATGATPVDPLTWTIEIRPGVKFHNGNVMDAQAVKASLERSIRLSPASAETLAIDSIVVEDEQTITVTTTEPRSILPGLLTNYAVAITDAAAADAAGEGNFIAAGALTGPYIPTEYVQKELLSSVANDDYWGGAPLLAGIEYLAIPDTNSRELALQAGDIDVAVNISPEGTQTINTRPDLHSRTAAVGFNVVMWWVNFERPALSDPLVRRAVVQAIDRESIAGLVAPEGAGSYAELLLPEALVSCPGVAALGYDPDQARDLLAQAGYVDTDGDGFVDKDGQALEIVIGAYPQRFQLPIMAEAAQAMLADVGIKVEVLITEWAVIKEPVWDLFGLFSGLDEGAGDPVLNVRKFVTRNYGHYDTSELAGVVARAGSVSDIEQRDEIACEALAMITEESPFLPVAHPYMVFGVSERVTGFDPHPSSHYYFFDHRIGLSE